MQKNQNYYLGVKAIIKSKTGTVLLLKHAKGHWDFPGGRIQESEQPIEALLREVSEETGLTALNINNIKSHSMVLTPVKISSENATSGLILWYHTCTLESDFPVVLSDEHTQYIWAPIDQVKALTNLDV